MVYTGYLWEQLLASTDQSIAECLTAIDLLVDGPFVEKQKCCFLFAARVIKGLSMYLIRCKQEK